MRARPDRTTPPSGSACRKEDLGNDALPEILAHYDQKCKVVIEHMCRHLANSSLCPTLTASSFVAATRVQGVSARRVAPAEDARLPLMDKPDVGKEEHGVSERSVAPSEDAGLALMGTPDDDKKECESSAEISDLGNCATETRAQH
ncbi:hypothetical protein MTO96_046664 [Rhipicephalus appendiculatus]